MVHAEKIRTRIYVRLIAKYKSIANLVFMFIKSIFRPSNIICIGPFILADNEDKQSCYFSIAVICHSDVLLRCVAIKIIAFFMVIRIFISFD